jgi:protein-S-isoprenylcysteine O-methyltransferase Ste14
MYVAVVTIILGQSLLFGAPGLAVYAVAVWAATAAFVRWYEEPRLAAQFGAGYARYRAAVPAWLPRLRPWSADDGPDPPRHTPTGRAPRAP